MLHGFSTDFQIWNPEKLQIKSGQVCALQAPNYRAHMSSDAQCMYSMCPCRMERKSQNGTLVHVSVYSLVFSNLHSSLIPLVLNVAIGHKSPQFHVIFDNKFETVNSLPLE
jgi:hypothetical protein